MSHNKFLLDNCLCLVSSTFNPISFISLFTHPIHDSLPVPQPTLSSTINLSQLLLCHNFVFLLYTQAQTILISNALLAPTLLQLQRCVFVCVCARMCVC